MVNALTVLLLCQLVGTVIQQALELPIPGPVFGMVMLLAWLIWRGGPSLALHDTAQGLLKYFGLLFVPAGVGIITEWQALRQNALAVIAALVVSAVLGLLVTGLVMEWFCRREARHADS